MYRKKSMKKYSKIQCSSIGDGITGISDFAFPNFKIFLLYIYTAKLKESGNMFSYSYSKILKDIFHFVYMYKLHMYNCHTIYFYYTHI